MSSFLSHARQWVFLIVIFAVLGGLWKYTPLSQYLDTSYLKSLSNWISGSRFPFLFVVLAYVVGSVILFPVTVLTVLCAMSLPFLSAVPACAVGVALSSCTGYAVGYVIGKERLQRFLGPTYAAIRRAVTNNEIVSIVIIRHLPLGPFSLVNLVLGSMHVNVLKYMLANGVSLLPTVIISNWAGYQLELH